MFRHSATVLHTATSRSDFCSSQGENQKELTGQTALRSELPGVSLPLAPRRSIWRAGAVRHSGAQLTDIIGRRGLRAGFITALRHCYGPNSETSLRIRLRAVSISTGCSYCMFYLIVYFHFVS